MSSASFPYDYIAVQVKKDKGAPMSSAELATYQLVMTARHADGEVIPGPIATSRDFNGDDKICWLKPFAMPMPGEWSITLELHHTTGGQGGGATSADAGEATHVANCAVCEFTLTVAEPTRAATFEGVVELEGGDYARLGEEFALTINAKDGAGRPFQMPVGVDATTYKISLERSASTRAEGVMLEASGAVWSLGEADEADGVRPLIVSGLQLRGKLAPNGKTVQLRFEAHGERAPSPNGGSCMLPLQIKPGVPNRLSITYGGTTEAYLAGGVAQAATDATHVHISGGELAPADKLKEIELSVFDTDGNLTAAEVYASQEAPNDVMPSHPLVYLENLIQ